MKEKPVLVLRFLRTFPSDRIPKATNDVNTQLFIHSFTFRDKVIMINVQGVKNCSEFYQQISESFCMYYTQL